jgi:hypothetical protein
MAPPKYKTDFSQLITGTVLTCDPTVLTPAKPKFDKSKMGGEIPLREGATSNPYTDYFTKDEDISAELKTKPKIAVIEKLRQNFLTDQEYRNSTRAHLIYFSLINNVLLDDKTPAEKKKELAGFFIDASKTYLEALKMKKSDLPKMVEYLLPFWFVASTFMVASNSPNNNNELLVVLREAFKATDQAIGNNADFKRVQEYARAMALSLEPPADSTSEEENEKWIKNIEASLTQAANSTLKPSLFKKEETLKIVNEGINSGINIIKKTLEEAKAIQDQQGKETKKIEPRTFVTGMTASFITYIAFEIDSKNGDKKERVEERYKTFKKVFEEYLSKNPQSTFEKAFEEIEKELEKTNTPQARKEAEVVKHLKGLIEKSEIIKELIKLDKAAIWQDKENPSNTTPNILIRDWADSVLGKIQSYTMNWGEKFTTVLNSEQHLGAYKYIFEQFVIDKNGSSPFAKDFKKFIGIDFSSTHQQRLSDKAKEELQSMDGYLFSIQNGFLGVFNLKNSWMIPLAASSMAAGRLTLVRAAGGSGTLKALVKGGELTKLGHVAAGVLGGAYLTLGFSTWQLGKDVNASRPEALANFKRNFLSGLFINTVAFGLGMGGSAAATAGSRGRLAQGRVEGSLFGNDMSAGYLFKRLSISGLHAGIGTGGMILATAAHRKWSPNWLLPKKEKENLSPWLRLDDTIEAWGNMWLMGGFDTHVLARIKPEWQMGQFRKVRFKDFMRNVTTTPGGIERAAFESKVATKLVQGAKLDVVEFLTKLHNLKSRLPNVYHQEFIKEPAARALNGESIEATLKHFTEEARVEFLIRLEAVKNRLPESFVTELVAKAKRGDALDNLTPLITEEMIGLVERIDSIVTNLVSDPQHREAAMNRILHQSISSGQPPDTLSRALQPHIDFAMMIPRMRESLREALAPHHLSPNALIESFSTRALTNGADISALRQEAEAIWQLLLRFHEMKNILPDPSSQEAPLLTLLRPYIDRVLARDPIEPIRQEVAPLVDYLMSLPTLRESLPEPLPNGTSRNTLIKNLAGRALSGEDINVLRQFTEALSEFLLRLDEIKNILPNRAVQEPALNDFLRTYVDLAIERGPLEPLLQSISPVVDFLMWLPTVKASLPEHLPNGETRDGFINQLAERALQGESIDTLRPYTESVSQFLFWVDNIRNLLPEPSTQNALLNQYLRTHVDLAINGEQIEVVKQGLSPLVDFLVKLNEAKNKLMDPLPNNLARDPIIVALADRALKGEPIDNLQTLTDPAVVEFLNKLHEWKDLLPETLPNGTSRNDFISDLANGALLGVSINNLSRETPALVNFLFFISQIKSLLPTPTTQTTPLNEILRPYVDRALRGEPLETLRQEISPWVDFFMKLNDAQRNLHDQLPNGATRDAYLKKVADRALRGEPLEDIQNYVEAAVVEFLNTLNDMKTRLPEPLPNGLSRNEFIKYAAHLVTEGNSITMDALEVYRAAVHKAAMLLSLLNLKKDSLLETLPDGRSRDAVIKDLTDEVLHSVIYSSDMGQLEQQIQNLGNPVNPPQGGGRPSARTGGQSPVQWGAATNAGHGRARHSGAPLPGSVEPPAASGASPEPQAAPASASGAGPTPAASRAGTSTANLRPAASPAPAASEPSAPPASGLPAGAAAAPERAVAPTPTTSAAAAPVTAPIEVQVRVTADNQLRFIIEGQEYMIKRGNGVRNPEEITVMVKGSVPLDSNSQRFSFSGSSEINPEKSYYFDAPNSIIQRLPTASAVRLRITPVPNAPSPARATPPARSWSTRPGLPEGVLLATDAGLYRVEPANSSQRENGLVRITPENGHMRVEVRILDPYSDNSTEVVDVVFKLRADDLGKYNFEEGREVRLTPFGEEPPSAASTPPAPSALPPVPSAPAQPAPATAAPSAPSAAPAPTAPAPLTASPVPAPAPAPSPTAAPPSASSTTTGRTGRVIVDANADTAGDTQVLDAAQLAGITSGFIDLTNFTVRSHVELNPKTVIVPIPQHGEVAGYTNASLSNKESTFGTIFKPKKDLVLVLMSNEGNDSEASHVGVKQIQASWTSGTASNLENALELAHNTIKSSCNGAICSAGAIQISTEGAVKAGIIGNVRFWTLRPQKDAPPKIAADSDPELGCFLLGKEEFPKANDERLSLVNDVNISYGFDTNLDGSENLQKGDLLLLMTNALANRFTLEGWGEILKGKTTAKEVKKAIEDATKECIDYDITFLVYEHNPDPTSSTSVPSSGSGSSASAPSVPPRAAPGGTTASGSRRPASFEDLTLTAVDIDVSDLDAASPTPSAGTAVGVSRSTPPPPQPASTATTPVPRTLREGYLRTLVDRYIDLWSDGYITLKTEDGLRYSDLDYTENHPGICEEGHILLKIETLGPDSRRLTLIPNVDFPLPAHLKGRIELLFPPAGRDISSSNATTSQYTKDEYELAIVVQTGMVNYFASADKPKGNLYIYLHDSTYYQSIFVPEGGPEPSLPGVSPLMARIKITGDITMDPSAYELAEMGPFAETFKTNPELILKVMALVAKTRSAH